jgi:hypothetical protein
MASPGSDHDCPPGTGTVLEAAAGFGLTSEEILAAVAIAIDRLPTDEKADCIDELAGEFGRSLVAKQRPPERSRR